MNCIPPSSRQGQAGFALIEALASAVVLAVVALAVLAGIDAAGSSTGREKSRSVAVTLAEQDQERMRAMRTEELENYSPAPRTEVVDKVTYTITSQGLWIRDDTGGTQSCTNNDRQVDYLKITSTVSSSVRTAKPAVLTSLVAPPPAAPQGTLIVKVLDRDNNPVSGLPVAIGGASSATATTNDVGCAIFTQIAVGDYTISLDKQSGNYPWVDKPGRSPATQGTVVTVGAVKLETMYFDQSGRIPVSFDTTNVGGLLGLPVGQAIASRGYSARVVAPPPTQRAAFTAASTTTPAATIVATQLFPFVEPYGVFAGKCDGANPGAAYFAATPGTSALVARALDTPVTVRQPALNVRVTRNTSSTGARSYVAPSQSNFVAKATMAADTSGCGETIDLTTWADTLKPGWVTKKNSPQYDPGIPFGSWQICAQLRNASGNNRRHTITVDNSGPAGSPATTALIEPLNTSLPDDQAGTC